MTIENWESDELERAIHYWESLRTSRSPKRFLNALDGYIFRAAQERLRRSNGG